MKNLFFILLILFSTNLFSQENKELSPVEFQKLKTAYVNMTNSESYREMNTQSKLIANKLNGLRLVNANNADDFNKFISENISKTKFSSINEANRMYKLMFDLTTKVMNKYKDVYIQFQNASQTQSLELIVEEQSRDSK